METPGGPFSPIFLHLAPHHCLSRTPCHQHTRILYFFNGRILILGPIGADLFVAGAGSMETGSHRNEEPRTASLPALLHCSNIHCVNMHASGQASPPSARPSFNRPQIDEIDKPPSQRLAISIHTALVCRRPSVY